MAFPAQMVYEEFGLFRSQNDEMNIIGEMARREGVPQASEDSDGTAMTETK